MAPINFRLAGLTGGVQGTQKTHETQKTAAMGSVPMTNMVHQTGDQVMLGKKASPIYLETVANFNERFAAGQSIEGMDNFRYGDNYTAYVV